MSVIIHPIKPVKDENSRTLVLGSFPSVKSRAANFYYAHPQNRFWRVLASVFCTPVPVTVEEKIALLKNNGIALYDVIEACEITGSADSSVKNVVPCDISDLLNGTKINRVFVNGKTAEKFYVKYLESVSHIKCVALPSTSPANAAYSLERLIAAWSVLKK